MSESKSDGSTASYYELPPKATELQHLISHRNMNAQTGEIFRACYRYGMASHSDQLRDAKKILFYAKAEVERLERQKMMTAEDIYRIFTVPIHLATDAQEGRPTNSPQAGWPATRKTGRDLYADYWASIPADLNRLPFWCELSDEDQADWNAKAQP